MKQPTPRTLIFDIETSHDILASYGLREQYHSPESILQDWYIICAKWKWNGGKRIYGTSVLDDMKRFKKDNTNDYVVIKALHELMSDVDIVVGHNIHRFDWKMFYTRVMFHRLPPLKMPQFICTLKETKKISRHSSHSLKHLARYYKLTSQKIEHSRGMGIKILKGDIKATQECVDYCGGDIATTEEYYEFIKPYMIGHPNLNLWRADGIECCVKCGDTDIQKRGFRTTVSGKFQSYQCQGCGSWMQGTRSIKRVAIR